MVLDMFICHALVRHGKVEVRWRDSLLPLIVWNQYSYGDGQ